MVAQVAEVRGWGLVVGRGCLGSSADFDRVGLDVVYDDGSLQRRLDGDYGDGVVTVRSALVPLTTLE